MTEQEFGALIRNKREVKKLSLEDMASRLKLSVSMLRSIEEGSLDRLPHAVYARGFIRAYAHAVDVAPEDIDAGISVLFPSSLFEDVPTVPSPIDSKPPRAKGQGSEKLLALIIAVCLLAIPLGGGWFVYTNYGEQIMDFVMQPLNALSSSPVSPPQTPEKPAAQERSALEPQQREKPVATAPAPAPQEQPITQSVAQPVPAPAAPAARPAPENTRAAAMAPAVSAPVDGNQVTIHAREECWVQVTVDGAGTRMFHVYAGETSMMPYKRKISLVLGNAGGVSVMHNGTPVPMNAKQNERRALTFP